MVMDAVTPPATVTSVYIAAAHVPDMSLVKCAMIWSYVVRYWTGYETAAINSRNSSMASNKCDSMAV